MASDKVHGPYTIIKLQELSDTPNYTGLSGKYLKVNTSANGIIYEAITISEIEGFPVSYTGHERKSVTVNTSANGLTYEFIEFTRLSDVPSNYSSAKGKLIRVNDTSTGLIFTDNLFIDSLGNLGFNTNTPNAIINYSGNSADDILNITGDKAYLAIQGSTNANIALVDTGASSNQKWMSLYTESGATKFRSLTDAGNATVKDSIIVMEHATGNVGIGVYPTAKAHIQSSISAVYAGIAPDLVNSTLTIANVVGSEAANLHSTIDFIVNGGSYNRVGSLSYVSESDSSRVGKFIFCVDDGSVRDESLIIENNRVTVTGDLVINGQTFTVNSTNVAINDPVFTLGNSTSPYFDDNKDRGVEFKWCYSSTGKLGYFGFDDSTQEFTFIPDATNNSEVFSGTQGTISARILKSTATNGTSPLTISSNTVVSSLNADLLDGQHSTFFSSTGHSHLDVDLIPTLQQITSTGSSTTYQITSTLANGTAPFSIVSSTGVTNLNSDLLDGHHATFFSSTGHTHPAGLAPQSLQQVTSTGATTNLQIVSTLVSGTAPFSVTSSTGVTNLNSDLLDGHHATYFEPAQSKGNLSASSPISVDQIRQVIGGSVTISHSTSTGYIHIPSGGSVNQLLKNSGSSGAGSWGTVTENAGALGSITTINMSGQLTNTLASGTAPFVITSSTGVTHLNADLWDGYEFSDYLNQNVKSSASPTFSDVTLSSLNRNSVTYGSDTKLFTGIPWGERGKFKVAFTHASTGITATVSFVGANTSFSYYINGKKFTVTSTGLSAYTKTATAAEGVWFFYINQTTTDVASPVMSLSQTSWNIYDPDVLLWNAYYNATSGSITWIGEERHTAGRDIYNHARNHAQGAIYKSGLTASSYNGLTAFSSNTDNNFGRAQIQIAGGSFFDEDILNNIAHTDASISSTTASPANDWNLIVNQFLGFTATATTGTNSTTIVFPTTRTLVTGQAITVMTGPTNTSARGTTTITTGGTGTSFTVTSVTGLASGDVIIVGARIPIYYISAVNSGVYTWRRLGTNDFVGATTQAATWTRSSATITGTFTNHGLQTGNIINVTVSSNTSAIPLNGYTVTKTGTNTFTFTGVALGTSTGTMTYVCPYNATTISNGVSQYNDPAAGGFTAVTSTRYFPVYLIATNTTSEPVIAILGQGQSTNATLATALGESNFQFQNLVGLGNLGIQEAVPFYRLTYQYSAAAGFNANRMRLMDATYINVRVATVSGTVIGAGTSIASASSVYTNTELFSGILTTAETTVQAALDKIDDFKTSPTFLTSITNPLLIGGTGTDSNLTLQSTSGVGATDYIKFLVGNNGATESMRLLTDGTVSIGHTVTLESASSVTGIPKLGVTKSAGAAILNISSYASGAAQAPVLLFSRSLSTTLGTQVETTDGTILGGFIFDGVNSSSAKHYGAGLICIQNGAAGGNYVPADLYFYTSTNATFAERMRITKDGYLGLNTTIPRCLTEIVNGTANTNADLPGTFTVVGPTTSTIENGGTISIQSNDAMGIDKGGILAFGGRYISANTTHAHWAAISGLKYSATSGEYGGNLVFYTRKTGESTTERMRINSLGQVGIGVSSINGSVIFEVYTTTASKSLIYAHSAVTSGTNYAIDAEVTGAGTATNIAGYFAAANGGTANYSIQIPSGYPAAGSTNYAIKSDSAAKSEFAGTITASELYRSSSITMKKNVLDDISFNAVDFINKIKIKEYDLKESGDHAVGFIAEETDPLISGKDQKGHNMGNHLSVLTVALQKAFNKIDELEKKIERMKNVSKTNN